MTTTGWLNDARRLPGATGTQSVVERLREYPLLPECPKVPLEAGTVLTTTQADARSVGEFDRVRHEVRKSVEVARAVRQEC